MYVCAYTRWKDRLGCAPFTSNLVLIYGIALRGLRKGAPAPAFLVAAIVRGIGKEGRMFLCLQGHDMMPDGKDAVQHSMLVKAQPAGTI